MNNIRTLEPNKEDDSPINCVYCERVIYGRFIEESDGNYCLACHDSTEPYDSDCED